MFIENEHPSDLKPQRGDMCIERSLCNEVQFWMEWFSSLVKESKLMQPEPLQNWTDQIVIDEAVLTGKLLLKAPVWLSNSLLTC